MLGALTLGVTALAEQLLRTPQLPEGRYYPDHLPMVRGHQGNGRDGVFMSSGDALDRELIMADFKALPGSKVSELLAHFDLVLGRTPDERTFAPNRPNRR